MLRRSFLSWLGLAPAAAVAETVSPATAIKPAEFKLKACVATLGRTQPQRHFRLWKLGSLEHRIFPTEAAFNRLADLLLKQDGESNFDLIWGPDIDVECVAVGEDTDLVAGPNVRLVRVDEKTVRVEVMGALSFFTRHALEPGQPPEFPLDCPENGGDVIVSKVVADNVITWLYTRQNRVTIPANLSRYELNESSSDLLFHVAGMPKTNRAMPRLDVSNTLTVRGRLLLVADREKLVLVEKGDKFGLAVLGGDAVWFADE